MRTEHLKYFIEVARCHSVKIAAENLFVTQPTISIALKNLEEELGKPLFFRSKNGMFLTEIGKTVFNKAEELLIKENELYSLISKEHQDTNILSGHLLISSAPLIACSFLKEIVLDFLKKNSDVKLTIHDSCARKSIYSLENTHPFLLKM